MKLAEHRKDVNCILKDAREYQLIILKNEKATLILSLYYSAFSIKTIPKGTQIYVEAKSFFVQIAT